MKIVIETSAWASFFEGNEVPTLELALQAGGAVLPALVLTELLSNQLSAKERSQLVDLLSRLSVYPDEKNHQAHYVRAGKLKSELEMRGVRLSARDAHVAQCAIDVKGVLLTRDSFFLELQKYAGVPVQM